MTKDEIIQATLQAMRQDHGLLAGGKTGDDGADEYEAVVIATLTERLPDGDIKTCADFGDLGVACCDTCHNFCPHCEMYIEDLPDGSKAWLCCFIRSALHGGTSPVQDDTEAEIDLEAALGGGIRNDSQECGVVLPVHIIGVPQP